MVPTNSGRENNEKILLKDVFSYLYTTTGFAPILCTRLVFYGPSFCYDFKHSGQIVDQAVQTLPEQETTEES